MELRNAHKARVAARFDAVASHYAEASDLQRGAAAELTRRIRSLGLPHDPRVLEIGCGTGHLTGMLQPQLKGSWVVTDISPQMVLACGTRNSGRAHYAVMDGERPAFRSCTFDLIVSNFAAQWFGDLRSAFAALGDLLAPGGYIALATLGRGTFAEWRSAHDSVGLKAATHDYPDADSLAQCFPRMLATLVEGERITQVFRDPADFVRSLKAIGADTPRAETRPLTAGQMRRVLRAFGTPEGVSPITYEVLYAISRRGLSEQDTSPASENSPSAGRGTSP